MGSEEAKFRQTEIVLTPEAWVIRPLSEVADVYLGGTPKTTVAEYWDGSIKWASAKDVSNTKARYIFHTERTITEAGIKNSAAKVLPRNTIVVTARGTVGEIAMLSEPMAFNQTCYGLKAKNIDALFLF